MEQLKTQTATATTTAATPSLLDEILSEGKLKPSDDGYDIARKGVHAFISEMLAGKNALKVDKTAVDAMIAEIDARLTAQVNEVLHQPEFQKLESAWRGLKFVVDRTDFR